MKYECNGCGYLYSVSPCRDVCMRPSRVKGWCTLDKAILTDAGVNPMQWKRYGENELYLYIQRIGDSHQKMIIDKERRMICR